MRGEPEQTEERPYLIVSSDGHAGPTLRGDLRPYCPTKYLDDFDRFVAEFEEESGIGTRPPFGGDDFWERTKFCPGQNDAIARRRDMDADGIAAEVIFAGGENDEVLPFVGLGFSAGPEEVSSELRAVGGQIWNEWLADFICDKPHRHVGVMQVPIWDVEAAIATVEWGRGVGLVAANFPAPRPDFPPYNDPIYEPFWAACAELGVTLMTHSGGGERSLGWDRPGGAALSLAEVHWLCRRSLAELVFGGAFERHPGLRVVYTEQRAGWIPETLRDFDSLYYSDKTNQNLCDQITKAPSEYWATNCYTSGSFLAPYEVELRYQIGVGNLLWGADYPHTEGTWPRTMLALRNTFAEVPEEETRRILGKTTLELLGLDADALRSIADRIGPIPSQLSRPLASEEHPEHPGLAFRTLGAYA